MTAPLPMASSNILELASGFFGTSEHEDLYAAFRDASRGRLEEFLDLYRKFASAGRLRAPLEIGQLRPYLPTFRHGMYAPWELGAFQLDSLSFADGDGLWQAVDQIKHRLLYCHSVAIEDPLGSLLAVAASSGPSEFTIAEWRTRLLNFVQFLIHLEPLIAANILCFMSPRAYLPSDEQGRTPTLVALLQKYIDEGGVAPVPVIDEYLRRAPDENAKAAVRNLASMKISSGQTRLEERIVAGSLFRIKNAFSAVLDAPAMLSPYLPFQYDVDLLGAFQNAVNSSVIDRELEAVPDDENRLMGILFKMDMPGVERLDIGDILAIRSGDAFANWHEELRSALSEAAAQPGNLLNYDQAARLKITNRIAAAKKRIDDEFVESSALKKFRSLSRALAFGSLGILASLYFVPLTMAVAGALAALGAREGAQLVYDQARSRKKSQDQKAAVSHYVALLD